MKRFSAFAAGTIGAAVLAAGVAFSQDKPSGQHMPGMGGMHSGQGMQGGMMGCPMMRQSGGGGASALIPQLPPGNEKLQTQMTAEIMQKAGEIAAKYAAQAK
jgi:hypothetical protein